MASSSPLSTIRYKLISYQWQSWYQPSPEEIRTVGMALMGKPIPHHKCLHKLIDFLAGSRPGLTIGQLSEAFRGIGRVDIAEAILGNVVKPMKETTLEEVQAAMTPEEAAKTDPLSKLRYSTIWGCLQTKFQPDSDTLIRVGDPLFSQDHGYLLERKQYFLSTLIDSLSCSEPDLPIGLLACRFRQCNLPELATAILTQH